MSAPGVRSGSFETPRTPFGGAFRVSAQTASHSAAPGASPPRVRHRSEAVDIDHGQLAMRRLKVVAVIVHLDEFAPVGRRATGGTDGRRHILHTQADQAQHPCRPTSARVLNRFYLSVVLFGLLLSPDRVPLAVPLLCPIEAGRAHSQRLSSSVTPRFRLMLLVGSVVPTDVPKRGRFLTNRSTCGTEVRRCY